MVEQEESIEEGSEKRSTRKRKKLVAVTPVEVKGESALVQWLDGDGLKRGYVPVAEIEDDGRVEKSTLDAAIPYGVPWGELLETVELRPEVLAAELKKQGLWASRDIEDSPRHAARALQAALGFWVGDLHRVAREYEKKEA